MHRRITCIAIYRESVSYSSCASSSLVSQFLGPISRRHSVHDELFNGIQELVSKDITVTKVSNENIKYCHSDTASWRGMMDSVSPWPIKLHRMANHKLNAYSATDRYLASRFLLGSKALVGNPNHSV